MKDFRNHAAMVDKEAKVADMIEAKQHRDLELANNLEKEKERQRK
jgi:hypothetical protein